MGRDGPLGGRYLRLRLGQFTPLIRFLCRTLASCHGNGCGETQIWCWTRLPRPTPCNTFKSLTFFFSLEEGSLPEQRPGSTPLAPFARVEDLARLLSTSSSSNFFLLMNL